MKFIVDELPYYRGECPFFSSVSDNFCYANRIKCPRYWDKEFICSDDNPHECKYLVEFDKCMESRK